MALTLCLSLCACGEPQSDDNNTADNIAAGNSNTTTSKHDHIWADATCTTPKTCTVCGATEGTVANHVYEETGRTEPTAGTDGSVTYTCSCGDYYNTVLPATGSAGLEYKLNSDGTYTVVGIGTCTDAHIYIPDRFESSAVTSIGDRAFSYCDSILSITIPDSVISIGYDVFYRCGNLTKIYVDENNTAYSSDSHGVLYNKGKSILIAAPKALSGSYTIPDGVTTLGSNAFYGCRIVKSITIPDSVTEIGNFAFSDCDALSSITIPESVTSIGKNAFWGCDSLISIAIPCSVISIGEGAFIAVRNLTKICVDENNPAYSSDGYGVLFNKDKTVLIAVPDALSGSYIVPDGVIQIDTYAFSGCESLIEVSIPNSLTDIGESAFSCCFKLQIIRFKGTKEQWNAIEKEKYWDDATGNYTIYCTDGEIKK